MSLEGSRRKGRGPRGLASAWLPGLWTGPEPFLTGAPLPSSGANGGLGTQYSLVSQDHLDAPQIGAAPTGLSLAQHYTHSQRLWRPGSNCS